MMSLNRIGKRGHSLVCEPSGLVPAHWVGCAVGREPRVGFLEAGAASSPWEPVGRGKGGLDAGRGLQGLATLRS